MTRRLWRGRPHVRVKAAQHVVQMLSRAGLSCPTTSNEFTSSAALQCNHSFFAHTAIHALFIGIIRQVLSASTAAGSDGAASIVMRAEALLQH